MINFLKNLLASQKNNFKNIVIIFALLLISGALIDALFFN
jgi:hypothetical protein